MRAPFAFYSRRLVGRIPQISSNTLTRIAAKQDSRGSYRPSGSNLSDAARRWTVWWIFLLLLAMRGATASSALCRMRVRGPGGRSTGKFVPACDGPELILARNVARKGLIFVGGVKLNEQRRTYLKHTSRHCGPYGAIAHQVHCSCRLVEIQLATDRDGPRLDRPPSERQPCLIL